MSSELLPPSLPAVRQGFRSLASFGFGGQESAPRSPVFFGCEPI